MLTTISGIWDCKSPQAVIEFVCRGIAAEQELHAIYENMMDHSLAPWNETGRSGTDNMTMIVIALLKNMMTKEEWGQTWNRLLTQNRIHCGDERRTSGLNNFSPPRYPDCFVCYFGVFARYTMPPHRETGRAWYVSPVAQLQDGTYISLKLEALEGRNGFQWIDHDPAGYSVHRFAELHPERAVPPSHSVGHSVG